MNTVALAELAKLKQGARAAWGAGDYAEIARRQLWPVGERIVNRASIRPGERVLDVACGTGNAALRAAGAGAEVTGLDLTPALLEAGKRLAAEEGVAVEWVEGDAEELPFADDSFEVVVSVFGCMFAPRHDVTACELARVLCPGGRLVVSAWTPEGATGTFFRTVGAYLPPPSPLAQPPALWGAEGHVDELFAGTGVEVRFERETLDPPDLGSAEDAIEFMATKFGPMMMARQLAEAGGRWDELRSDLTALYERREPAEYLVTLGTKEES
jgi:SAM-dependent methyltransferase